MVREDLIASAVTFLQDPSVAASALDKKLDFLRSKNLTQEEIDASLARAEDATQIPRSQVQRRPPRQYAHPSYPVTMQPSRYGYGNQDGPEGLWNPQPPPQPRRDWRDWFIVATVTTGVGYGLLTIAQRYVLPLISPPTPPQIEQDKASIDESFNRAFALIDQLTKDTAEIKIAEEERSQKMDSTMGDVTTVIADLKAANAKQELENRLIADQVRGLTHLIPKSLNKWKAGGDARLDELGQEIQSLKKLLENRVGRHADNATPPGRSHGSLVAETSNTQPTSSTSAEVASHSKSETTGTPAPAPGITVPRQEAARSKPGFGGIPGKPSIPAWQMAAAKNSATTGLDTNGEGKASDVVV